MNNVFEQLSDLEKNKNRLSILMKDRTVVTLFELCEQYKEHSSPEAREFLNVLLTRNDYANNCTVILGDTRESSSSRPGISLLEGSLDDDSSINPQAIVQDILVKDKIINSKFVRIEIDLKNEQPKQLIDIAAHELAHTFTQYIVSSFQHMKNGNKTLVKRLNPAEIEFYSTVYKIHQDEFIPDLSKRTSETYLLELSEFLARALTSASSTVYGKYHLRVLEAFKKMYINNTRKIISLSKFLEDNS